MNKKIERKSYGGSQDFRSINSFNYFYCKLLLNKII